jgi:hypothetical protein
MVRFRLGVALFLSVAVLIDTQAARAGASNARMTCHGSGKHADLRIVADIPGDLAEYDVKFSYKSADKVWNDSNNPMVVSVHDFERGIFVVGIGDEFVLYADSKTIKFVKKEPNRELHASFRAFVSSPNPGAAQIADAYFDHVTLTCKYDFSI